MQWLRTTARESAYLALGLPVSVVAFAVLVAGLTAGGVLAITLIGLPVILAFFLAAGASQRSSEIGRAHV